MKTCANSRRIRPRFLTGCHIGTLDDDALAQRLHARAIYQAMKDLSGARHLTTLMCAKHRSKALDEIRKDLKEGRPCRLVSTSLILLP